MIISLLGVGDGVILAMIYWTGPLGSRMQTVFNNLGSCAGRYTDVPKLERSCAARARQSSDSDEEATVGFSPDIKRRVTDRTCQALERLPGRRNLQVGLFLFLCGVGLYTFSSLIQALIRRFNKDLERKQFVFQVGQAASGIDPSGLMPGQEVSQPNMEFAEEQDTSVATAPGLPEPDVKQVIAS